MQIGKVIRKHRKEKGLTQEEMANRLGVTAPAVNKWERGVTLPDIALLSPIARLLGITVDTLLSFREEPTQEQIDQMAAHVDAMLESQSYADAFQWVREQLRLWPGSETLHLRMGQFMDARRSIPQVPDAGSYDDELIGWFRLALESTDSHIARESAHWLYAIALRRGRYDEAESYLSHLPEDDPQRKRMQADIYAKTGQEGEAYKSLEELLFAEYQTLSAVFASLYMLAMEQDDRDKARYYEDKRRQLAAVFEMGAYHECTGLELAILEKDADAAIPLIKTMLTETESIFGFTHAPLYAHMEFRDTDEGQFIAELRRNLLAGFREEEFLRSDPRFQSLIRAPEG